MPFGFRSNNPNPIISPVLAVDTLGFSAEIDKCEDPESLAALARKLDAQFHGFRSKIPHEIIFVTKKRVIGTREFSTLRLNDMFILFSERSRHRSISVAGGQARGAGAEARGAEGVSVRPFPDGGVGAA